MASIGYGTGSPLRQKNAKFNNAKKFLSLQVSQTGHAISNELSHMLRAQTLARKRKRVINELFTTEKTYHQHLHALTRIFLSELQAVCIVPTHVLNTIFSNIEAIVAINKELLCHMETLGVGDAFLAMAPFIKLYSTYANNFEHASNLLLEWEKKSPEFVALVTRQEAREECRGLNLRALLITPVQRVPRYKLLLESLLNKTPREHPDFSKLEEATCEIAKVAEHINENIRQHENFQKMLSIQKSLTGEGAPKILAPGRFFIKEGPLLKACRRRSQERMFFLFSDILIYAKKCSALDKDQSTYTCRRVFPLFESELEQMFGSSVDTDGAADVGALFKVTCRDKSLLLYSKSRQEAASWFNAIKDAIGNLKTNRASLRRVSRGESELGKRNTPVRRSAVLKARFLRTSKLERLNLKTNRASLRRVSRGESELGKRDTPVRRSAVLKARFLRTSKEFRKRAASLECLSPVVCIKDSLYPLRKELGNKNTTSATPKTLPSCKKPRTTSQETVPNSPWLGPSTSGGNYQGNIGESTTQVEIPEEAGHVGDKDSLIDSPWFESDTAGSSEDDAHDSDDENCDYSGTSGDMVNSYREAMIGRMATPSGSMHSPGYEEMKSLEYEGVMTRERKRKFYINENENQIFNYTSEMSRRRKWFLPNLSCVRAMRTPLMDVYGAIRNANSKVITGLHTA